MLFIVNMWFIGAEDEIETTLVIAENEQEAERIACEDDIKGYDCFEAEEVTEINGYKIIFEKIAK
jgi:hypothetical protein